RVQVRQLRALAGGADTDHQRHGRLPGDPAQPDAEGDPEQVRGRLRELAPADLRAEAAERLQGAVAADGAVAPRLSVRRRELREGVQGLLMVRPPVAVVAVFIGFPIVAPIAYTLGRAGGPNSVVASLGQRQFIVHHGVTLDAYRDILGNKTIHRDLWATVWVTIVVTILVLAASWAI